MIKTLEQTKGKTMSIKYLNTKIAGKVETIDHLDSNVFKDRLAFKKEMKRLISEYKLAGGHGALYWSSRSTKSYK